MFIFANICKKFFSVTEYILRKVAHLHKKKIGIITSNHNMHCKFRSKFIHFWSWRVGSTGVDFPYAIINMTNPKKFSKSFENFIKKLIISDTKFSSPHSKLSLYTYFPFYFLIKLFFSKFLNKLYSNYNLI